MKLATYKDGSRDGQLVVVSHDLSTAHFANGIASRLQQVLDDWNFLSPQLQDLYVTLNQGRARHAFAFEPRQCMAPLPRAYQFAGALAYPSHLARLHAAGQSPASASTDTPIYQGGSDDFLGACDNAWFGSARWDIDFEAGLAVVTGDLAMGASAAQGLDSVRLLMLANAWCLRGLLPGAWAPGLGPVQARPAAGFGPVAVTPDELGDAWQQGRVALALQASINSKKVGLCETGPEMAADFGQLLAQLSQTRNLRAGTVLAAAPVSNLDRSRGQACLADKRALEATEQGSPHTPYLALGDLLRLEVKGRDGHSVFGALSQRVVGPGLDDGPSKPSAADAPTVVGADG